MHAYTANAIDHSRSISSILAEIDRKHEPLVNAHHGDGRSSGYDISIRFLDTDLLDDETPEQAAARLLGAPPSTVRAEPVTRGSWAHAYALKRGALELEAIDENHA